MADIPIQVDGDDTFVSGMDSFTMQSKLTSGQYALAMNVINRGGLLQTRPGSSPLPLVIPTGDQVKVQGLTVFKPSNSSNPALVFAIGGLVFYSYAPFTQAVFLNNIQFSPNSKFVSWASCVQYTYIDDAGEIQFLEKPRAILVMQDGNTRAAYWDGVNNGHLDPSLSETPVGLWMSWSNNRLWVSRGAQVFASDIGNPLKFTETQYLNEGRSFYLPDECTGIAETPDKLGIVCFTKDTTTLIQSSIQDRTIWLTTPSFQQLTLPNLGCVAPRSIAQQYGILWWMSSRGLISLDNALQTKITSKLITQDVQMSQAKYGMDSDHSGICGIAIENLLLHAIPVSDSRNNRVMVLDQAPANGAENSWASYWTGWRPVEFAKGNFAGSDCLFTISHDYDNGVRIWQMLKSDKTDGGIPITSFVVTKQHFFGNRDFKRFKYAEIELQAVSGATAIAVGVSGIKNGFQKILEKDLSATNGQVYYNEEYGYTAEDLAGSKPQSRIIRTIDMPNPTDCNKECIESPERGLVDKAFSILIVWSGIAGISAYRLFAQGEPRAHQGICEDNETGEDRLINQDGCGIFGLFLTTSPFPTYWATATYSQTIPNFPLNPYELTITQPSVINQADADRKALATAKFYVNQIAIVFNQ